MWNGLPEMELNRKKPDTRHNTENDPLHKL